METTSNDFLPLIHVYPACIDHNKLRAIPGVNPSQVLKRLASQVWPEAHRAATELLLKGQATVYVGDEKIELNTR